MIYTLKEQTEEKQKQIVDYYEKVLLSGAAGFTWKRPNTEFDDYGLRFDINYLNQVDKAIIGLPLEYMAEYCDIVTKSMIDANEEGTDWKMFEVSVDDVEKDYDNYNATSIGNLAYVALYCKNDEIADKAAKVLHKIFVIYKGKTLNELNEKL